jgi:hypothetical protein
MIESEDIARAGVSRHPLDLGSMMEEVEYILAKMEAYERKTDNSDGIKCLDEIRIRLRN